MADWTDEKKAKVIADYEAAEPTSETSMSIVEEIADEINESVNGVRMILTRAGVYLKKAPATKKAAASGDKPASTRVSKEDSQAKLVTAIEANGHTADMEIVSKLTGKAAVYLASIMTNNNA